MTTVSDRAAGAIIGALVGYALGLGPPWYYDLAELRREYGDWISGYTDPKPNRYHSGIKAGQLDQTGLLLVLLLRSVIENGWYNENDFTHRLDEFFKNLDGNPIRVPADIPVNPFGKPFEDGLNAALVGQRPEATPTLPKRRNAL